MGGRSETLAKRVAQLQSAPVIWFICISTPLKDRKIARLLELDGRS